MAQNLSIGQRMRAKRKSIVTAASLAAAYADVGSAINMRNMHDATLYLAEVVGTENALVKVFLSPDLTTPAATTGLYQLCTADGAEVVVTVVTNTTQVYSLGACAANYLFLQGQGAIGANADLTASLLGNIGHDGQGSRLMPAKINIISTATALTATPTLTGSVVNIRGMGHLTLYVSNTDVAVNATITPYVAFSDAAPTALTSMYSLDVVAGTAKTFVTLANEKAAHPLLGVSGDWLALSCSGNGADIVAYLFGTLSGQAY